MTSQDHQPEAPAAVTVPTPLTRRSARRQVAPADVAPAEAAPQFDPPDDSAEITSAKALIAASTLVAAFTTAPTQDESAAASVLASAIEAPTAAPARRVRMRPTTATAANVRDETPVAVLPAEHAQGDEASESVIAAASVHASPSAEAAAAPTAQAAAESAPRAEYDVFAAASQLFAAAAPGQDEVMSVPRHRAASAADAVAAHVAPQRERVSVLRKLVTVGASAGVMGIAGLLAVSMTVPAEAVAAAQGATMGATTSLVAQGPSAAAGKVDEGEIQAFVAPTAVQNETLAGAAGFSTISRAELAAEQGIRYSDSLYTNDPNAAIQWPYVVGVAMSSPYGPRWGQLHAGIDLVPGEGAPIQAIADGVVRLATESDGGYGVGTYIDHVIDGQVITSHYAHMQYGSQRLKTGDIVKVGDIVGLTGNTGRSYGAHLHFELIVNGSTIDPLPWMMANAGRK